MVGDVAIIESSKRDHADKMTPANVFVSISSSARRNETGPFPGVTVACSRLFLLANAHWSRTEENAQGNCREGIKEMYFFQERMILFYYCISLSLEIQ